MIEKMSGEEKKIIEQRSCVGCRTKKNKSELIRCVRLSTGVEIDPEQKKQGRGAYICRDAGCLEKIRKKRLLNRALKVAVDETVYDELEKLITRCTS